MFIGREKELLYLNEFEKKAGTQILVLYGQKGIGKTTLLKKFLEGKEGFYYEAVSCSARQQQVFMAGHLKDMGISMSDVPKFEEILAAIEESGRKIFVIDEFQNICRTENDFFESFYIYLKHRERGKDLFLILCTSFLGWVENSMIHKLGEFSTIINDSYKLKELKYQDFKEYFPLFSKEDSVGAFSILGGVPGLWKCFDDKFTLRENIEKYILQKEEKLFDYGQQYVAEELRETAVYNTILTALAGGKGKLNELYQVTGFSRAKISVYLKNLMQLELVEKVISVDTEGREKARKGIYRISHPYVHFYYCYIFPNQNKVGVWKTEKIYEQIIAPSFSAFTAEGFRKVCLEFLELENTLGRLPEHFSYLGQWVGKKGSIDFIFQDEDKEILAGICNWEKEMMMYEDYKLFMECQENAKINAEYMILFSAGKFDNRLREEAKKNPYLALVCREQMKGF